MIACNYIEMRRISQSPCCTSDNHCCQQSSTGAALPFLRQTHSPPASMHQPFFIDRNSKTYTCLK
uniref:Uncharacterized protein n=1 Tax=Octopus bimaculoides TaxID=37653 RepID=A0A0L8HZJ3_OCTBM